MSPPAQRVGAINGFDLYVPTSGGKAGKGCNKTASIQIRKDGCVVKNIRFTLADEKSRKAAMMKARDFCDPDTAEQRHIERLVHQRLAKLLFFELMDGLFHDSETGRAIAWKSIDYHLKHGGESRDFLTPADGE